MKHRLLFTLGIVLVLFILPAAACASTAAPENITVTFSADEKCTLQGPATIPSGKDVTLEVIGNIKEHDTVGIAILNSIQTKPKKILRICHFMTPSLPGR